MKYELSRGWYDFELRDIMQYYHVIYIYYVDTSGIKCSYILCDEPVIMDDYNDYIVDDHGILWVILKQHN